MKLLMIGLLVWRAGAEPILFRAADSSELEYRARLRSEESFQTPTQAYLSQHPTPHARETLLNRFARAQGAFLNNSIGEARRHFQEVVALLPTDDWAAVDREVFVHAFLRLAQLEKGAADRDHWLEQIPRLGSEVKIQNDLFPPPVLDRLRAITREQPSLELDPARAEWPLVLINGVSCRARACPRFPAAESSVRLTFVSDQWVTQTVHADLGELKRLRPPKVSWVTGTCARGGLTPAARELGPGRAFFGLECETAGRDPRPGPAESLAPPLPRVVENKSSLPAAAVAPVESSRRPLYKSPWVWVGLGAVALTVVAVAVASSGHHGPAGSAPVEGPPAPPTTTYGF